MNNKYFTFVVCCLTTFGSPLQAHANSNTSVQPVQPIQAALQQPIVEDTALMVAFWRQEQRPDRYSQKMIEGQSRPEIADILIEAIQDADLPVYFRQDYMKSLLNDPNGQYQQVIVLGAGLSPLSAEFAKSDRVFIEMDLSQDNLDYKKYKYQSLTDVELLHMHFIVGDYIKNFEQITQDDLFRADAKTLVIMEGNTMYLTRSDFEQTLRNLHAAIEQVDVAFDFFSDTVVDLKKADNLTTGDSELDSWARSPVGQLFKTGYNKQTLQFSGYETQQALFMAELANVGPFERTDSIVGQHSGVCLLRKKV